MNIPVEVQKPNNPRSARCVGEAPESATAEEVARAVGVPEGCLVDGKVVRRDGWARWSLVAYVEFAVVDARGSGEKAARSSVLDEAATLARELGVDAGSVDRRLDRKRQALAATREKPRTEGRRTLCLIYLTEIVGLEALRGALGVTT